MPRTPVNHCAKFDAANFILGGEIRNCTNTHTHKRTNNAHTQEKQTLTDISTPWAYRHVCIIMMMVMMVCVQITAVVVLRPCHVGEEQLMRRRRRANLKKIPVRKFQAGESR